MTELTKGFKRRKIASDNGVDLLKVTNGTGKFLCFHFVLGTKTRIFHGDEDTARQELRAFPFPELAGRHAQGVAADKPTHKPIWEEVSSPHARAARQPP